MKLPETRNSICKKTLEDKFCKKKKSSRNDDEQRPWHSCFPVNFAKFLRTPFLQNTSERQFLFSIMISDHQMLNFTNLIE